MKLKCPELFRCPLPSDEEKVFDLQAQNMLLQRDQSGRRIYVIRVGKYYNKIKASYIFGTRGIAD